MRASGGLLVIAAAIAGAGCGYIGEPLPPLLHIPVPVKDLTAVQRGDRIVAQFKVPRETTEGTVLRESPDLDLRAGPGPDPWSQDVWAAQAKPFQPARIEHSVATYQIPAAGWAGKTVVVAVRAVGPSGREGGWSNLASVAVLPPLAAPAGVRAEAVPAGVRVTWQGTGPLYRVFRRAPGEQAFAAAGDADRPEWTDTGTAYGKSYEYEVQAIAKTATGEAQSNLSALVRITPVDVFPPQPPAGLNAVAGTGSIELVWDRNTEPDFASYRVYRAEGGGEFRRVAETGVTPSFGDRNVQAGKTYRYQVTAVDASGNESAPGAAMEVTAQ